MKILSQKETQNGLLQSFFEGLKRMFSKIKEDKNIDVDELVVSQGQTDEEKEILKEICEDIHSFNSNFRELHDSKTISPSLTDTEWLEGKMEKEANALANTLEQRDITAEEKFLLKEEFIKKLDEQIEQESEMLSKEINYIAASMVQSDNNKEDKHESSRRKNCFIVIN